MPEDSPDSRLSAPDDPRRKELLNSVFQLRGSEFSRCLWPDMSCTQPAIRAHSVQNATALDLLAEDGHVIAPVLRLSARTGPRIELRRVGRNRATTFAGLCATHDQEIFAPIETTSLDLSEVEHRFLLAYRATFYELHSTLRAGAMTQAGYLESARLGLSPRDQPSPIGMFAVTRMMLAWHTWQYKAHLDLAYLENKYDSLEHDLIELTVTKPTVAASALFSLDDVERGDDIVRVCITVLPVAKERTVALLSYLPGDAGRARLALDRVLSTKGPYQQYELSRRLINHCENFVLAPSFVESWSKDRRQLVIDLFTRTLGKNDLDFEDERLTLFA